MAEINVVTSKRGYKINIGNRTLFDIHSVFVEVLNQSQFGRLNNKTRLETIMLIKSLLRVDIPHGQGSLRTWLLSHITASEFNEAQAGVFDDTMRFITKGYRKLPLRTYDQFNAEFDESSVGIVSTSITRDTDLRYQRLESKRKKLINHIRQSEDEVALFWDWLKADDGFIDLVMFFNYITEPDPSV